MLAEKELYLAESTDEEGADSDEEEGELLEEMKPVQEVREKEGMTELTGSQGGGRE